MAEGCWIQSGSLLQPNRGEFTREIFAQIVISCEEDSIEYNISLKQDDTKKYEHGLVVGYAIATTKKSRIWQWVDAAGTSRFQKEAWGILIANPFYQKQITHSSAASLKCTSPWCVIRKDAVVKAEYLKVGSGNDLSKLAVNLLVNANIKVMYDRFLITSVIEKAGNLE